MVLDLAACFSAKCVVTEAELDFTCGSDCYRCNRDEPLGSRSRCTGTGCTGTGCISRQWASGFFGGLSFIFCPGGPHIGGGHEARVCAWCCGAGCFLRVCTGRLCSAQWLSWVR